ncbi:MAG TPA: hypothetical protein VFZ52_13180 [Chryseolinea sp.]
MNIEINLVVLFVFALTACAQETKTTDRFEKGKILAELQNKKLKEISGVASSVRNEGMLWAHNDSGNDPEIYLLNEKLETVLTCHLNGIENRDWEDIAVGPGPDPGKTYVYVADIGDNDAAYPYKYIYRFEEPEASGVSETDIASIDRVVFRLPKGIKDTESLMIDHKTRNLYVISKRENPVYLYELRFPYSTTDTLTAAEVTSLPFSQIVSADYSKRGDVLMKNYESIFYWENTLNEDLITLLKRQPVQIAYQEEPQGEAIAWAVDGSGFYTLSETKKKKQSFLYYYQKIK